VTHDARHEPLSVIQDSLSRDVAAVRARLEALLDQQDGLQAPLAVQARTLRAVSTAFGLTDFEAQLLLLCAAVELDSSVSSLCGRLEQHDGPGRVSFALASRALDEAHWSALLPTGPLRYWRLLDVESRREGALANARLSITERALHHLTGLVYLDESLHGLLAACRPAGEMWVAHAAIATRLSRHLASQMDSAVALTGCDAPSRRDVVASACAEIGARLFVLRGDDVASDSGDRERFARLWMRDALLSPAVLLIEGGTSSAVTALTDRIDTALVVSADDSVHAGIRPFVRLQLASPSAGERRQWWRSALGERGEGLNGRLDALAVQFDLNPGQIAAAIDGADAETPQALWTACRLQARPSLGDLAQRIEPSAGWDDLVLPTAQLGVLRQIAVHVRQRLTVYEEWGFGTASRGLGISALFAGVSGTGKTMASEVLARELQLDLYRIDLSQVVSKYIGETEKNLRRVFDAAEGGGAILLFDEADALFGKRSEVKDSHDRYANIEVSYLLQRMEAYRGLAILTTNQRAALDHAFLRRLRFVLEFPFPDAAGRAEIWRRVFPAATPTEGLDAVRLARLNVSGGNIRNIALNAAFLAADAGRAIGIHDVLHAARSEYSKMDKALTDAEVRDWA